MSIRLTYFKLPLNPGLASFSVVSLSSVVLRHHLNKKNTQLTHGDPEFVLGEGWASKLQKCFEADKRIYESDTVAVA